MFILSSVLSTLSSVVSATPTTPTQNEPMGWDARNTSAVSTAFPSMSRYLACYHFLCVCVQAFIWKLSQGGGGGEQKASLQRRGGGGGAKGILAKERGLKPCIHVFKLC